MGISNNSDQLTHIKKDDMNLVRNLGEKIIKNYNKKSNAIIGNGTLHCDLANMDNTKRISGGIQLQMSNNLKKISLNDKLDSRNIFTKSDSIREENFEKNRASNKSRIPILVRRAVSDYTNILQQKKSKIPIPCNKSKSSPIISNKSCSGCYCKKCRTPSLSIYTTSVMTIQSDLFQSIQKNCPQDFKSFKRPSTAGKLLSHFCKYPASTFEGISLYSTAKNDYHQGNGHIEQSPIYALDKGICRKKIEFTPSRKNPLNCI